MSNAEPVIAPSILAADFARLGEEAEALDYAGWLHIDMMDAPRPKSEIGCTIAGGPINRPGGVAAGSA